MKKNRILCLASVRLAALFAVMAASMPAAAQSEDTEQGAAAARVAQPIQITNTQSLEFGQITTNGTGIGRVTINARTGARTSNANVTRLGTTGFRRALFVVTGSAGRMVNLTTSSASFTLTGPGPAMTVNTLRVSRNNSTVLSLPRAYVLPASGTMTIGFGGRLNIANNQTPGMYSGTFDLIATYQ